MKEDTAIIRTWKARTTIGLEQQYIQQVKQVVLPYLRTFSGYNGSYFSKQEAAGEIEILVITLWDSEEAVKNFAGDEATHAYMPPEIAQTLLSYDESSEHYDVIIQDK